MEKFLLVLFFIIKILIIIVIPTLLFFYRKNEIKKVFIYSELCALLLIMFLYLIDYSYITDSNVINLLKTNLLSDSVDVNSLDLYGNIDTSNSYSTVKGDTSYKTHKGENVYFYNGFDKPLSLRKVECNNDYDYLRSYSSIISSTSMLLSTYFNKDIDPIELYNKAHDNNLIKCDNPINKDDFFNMIKKNYNVEFSIIKMEQLNDYLVSGKPVLLETKGNGNLSCVQGYFLIYDVNNNGDYLLLDPINKSYSYLS